MSAIFWKELKSYFYSPIAYVLIGLLTIASSILFYAINLVNSVGDVGWIFANGLFIFVMIIFVSILTMKILAEDRKNGTEVLLITSPQSISSIVIGKYLASLCVFLVMVVITFIYPLIISLFGGHITAVTISGYIGFILIGAAFVSIGVFASSLSENQIISVIISFVIMLIMWLIGAVGPVFGGTLSKVLSWISLTSRYDEFNKGILGLGPVVYYLSFIAVFLFFTIRVIEKRRWSQG